ncbi:unnamed protein product [Gordionus sp. m RMFG-2023]|uniref:amino acid transporter heavy chain SLC3A1-like n=1 Tax=Gordionus sp. m RMFG-2023 TaxID=3053472 RepID=UPI0030E3421C
MNKDDKKNGDNDTKIKFIQDGKNLDDAKVKIEGREDAFTGLTKEELMEYANDPFWVRLRWFLFILFWLVWIAMLVVAIVLIIRAPSCSTKKAENEAKDSAIYQIYPRSFKDSNGDGVGDLLGIVSKLDYIAKLNPKFVLINSPLQTNPLLQDEGLVNFTKINTEYGTNSDFKALIDKIHEKGMKVIMELDIHHSSNLHPWFQKSLAGTTRHREFYVWENGNGGNPPSNERSFWVGSTWTFSPERNQYYLSHFASKLPNLNLNSEALKTEIKDIIEFWLKYDVDGFLFPNADIWFKYIPTTTLNISSMPKNITLEEYKTNDLISFIKDVIENANKNRRIMLVEPYLEDSTMLYGSKADIVVNKALTQINGNCDAQCVANYVQNVRKQVPEKKGTWMLGNKDVSRITSRMGSQTYVNALNALLLLLPGTSLPYYGDEIGLTDNPLSSLQQSYDPLCKIPFKGECRDMFRSPMQWKPQNNAGFSNVSSQSWTPVNQNFESNNVETLEQTNKYIPVFSQLMALKKTDPFSGGHFKIISQNPNIFAFVRKCHDSPNYITLINLGKETSTFVNNRNVTQLSDKAEIVLDSLKTKASLTPPKVENLLQPMTLVPGQVIVLKLKE